MQLAERAEFLFRPRNRRSQALQAVLHVDILVHFLRTAFVAYFYAAIFVDGIQHSQPRIEYSTGFSSVDALRLYFHFVGRDQVWHGEECFVFSSKLPFEGDQKFFTWFARRTDFNPLRMQGCSFRSRCGRRRNARKDLAVRAGRFKAQILLDQTSERLGHFPSPAGGIACVFQPVVQICGRAAGDLDSTVAGKSDTPARSLDGAFHCLCDGAVLIGLNLGSIDL